MVAYAQVFLFDAQFLQELEAVVFPVFKPFEVGVGLAEKFHFHLLELAQTENKVAGRYFVAEALAYLAYSERHARPSRTGHVFEVYENALRRFGAKIACGHRIFGYALERLKHEVEFFDGRKIGLAADGAGQFVFGDERGQRVVVHARNGHGHFVLGGVRFDEIVGAATAFARAAVHEWVGKAREVSRCFPYFGVHEYGAVQTEVVFAFGDELLPPRLFDIVVQFHADGTVIPRVGEAAVNIAARKNKSAGFAQRDEFVHCYFHKTDLG